MENRKAQVAETITWVVATIIIVFLISASIYAAVLLGKTKVVDKSKAGITGTSDINWIGAKSLFAFEKNSKNKDEINTWLKGSDLNADS